MSARGGLFALTVGLVASLAHAEERPLRVGSKKFTESVILGEIVAQRLDAAGIKVAHRREIGGSRVLWEALVRGDLDVYPEYTGTLREELLPESRGADLDGLRAALARRGIRSTGSLGFENTYAIGMREERARALGIETLSDLARHPELKLGFTNEFMDRKDGWPALRNAYRITDPNVRGLDHDVAYRALAQGNIDATDLYSTDAEIKQYGLRVLEDDLKHFPEYAAVLLYRSDLDPAAVRVLESLEKTTRVEEMISLNARAKVDGVPEPIVARDYLASKFGIVTRVEIASRPRQILRWTWEHLVLVGLSLCGAVLVAIPLGIVAARKQRAGQILLGVAGVLQTIPALALLVLMIPLFGIGAGPAMAALFLYSLLPILRNTQTGITGIPLELKDTAEALGLSGWERLRFVELPMASRSILAGVKTSAVINVGTATLGALIGAGGYGQPILTGIRLDDVGLILQGALPAAALALLVQALFELLERRFVPAGLRVGRAS